MIICRHTAQILGFARHGRSRIEIRHTSDGVGGERANESGRRRVNRKHERHDLDDVAPIASWTSLVVQRINLKIKTSMVLTTNENINVNDVARCQSFAQKERSDIGLQFNLRSFAKRECIVHGVVDQIEADSGYTRQWCKRS